MQTSCQHNKCLLLYFYDEGLKRKEYTESTFCAILKKKELMASTKGMIMMYTIISAWVIACFPILKNDGNSITSFSIQGNTSGLGLTRSEAHNMPWHLEKGGDESLVVNWNPKTSKQVFHQATKLFVTSATKGWGVITTYLDLVFGSNCTCHSAFDSTLVSE